MGKGAPKNVSAIPTAVVVDILAKEALAEDSFNKFRKAVTEVLNGNDDPETWQAIERLRERTYRDVQIYTIAVRNLERSQDRG